MNFVDAIFGACCLAMNRMAMLFGSDYETVNVVLFDFIEPILTVLVLIGVVLGRFGSTRDISQWIGWGSVIVVAVVLIVLAVSFISMIPMVSFHPLHVDPALLDIHGAPEGSFIHRAFQWTVDILIGGGKGFGMTYNLINLVVYIFMMPITILVGQIIVLR